MALLTYLRLLLVLILLAACFFFVKDSVTYWESHPSFNSIELAGQKEIDFPAVTVCANFETKWQAINNLLQKYDTSNDIFDVFANDTGLIYAALNNYLVMYSIEYFREDSYALMGSDYFLTQILLQFLKTGGISGALNVFLESGRNMFTLDQLKQEVIDNVIGQKDPMAGIEEFKEKYQPANKNISTATLTLTAKERDKLESVLSLLHTLPKLDRKSLITLAVDIASHPMTYAPYSFEKHFRFKLLKYIGGKTKSLLGLPAPVLYDLYFKDPADFDVEKPCTRLFSVPDDVFNRMDHMYAWLYCHYKILEVGIYTEIRDCKYNDTHCNPTKLKNRISENKVMIGEFLSYTNLDIHEPSPQPLIPFCSFGGKQKWIGNKQDNASMTTCNLFQHTYSFDRNCFTTKPDLQCEHNQSRNLSYLLTQPFCLFSVCKRKQGATW